MTTAEITEKIVRFIRENLITGDQDLSIDESTELLGLGILDSLKTAILLNYIRDELKTHIPPQELTSRNFASPKTIAAMVHDAMATAGA